MEKSEEKIRELITELYPIEDSENPFLLVFQVIEVAKAYAEQENKALQKGLEHLQEQIVRDSTVQASYTRDIKALQKKVEAYVDLVEKIINHINDAEYTPYQEELLAFMVSELKSIKQALKQ